MMKRTTSLIALISVIAVSGLAMAASRANTASATGSGSRAYLHSYNLPSSGVALEGYCPVAYFAVNKPVRGKAAFASMYNGVTYHLVSADAQRMFEADPQKYLPAYGGWCAFGMAVQDKFPVDPTNFSIENGRLLLFLRNDGVDAKTLWGQGDRGELTRKADAHWRTVQK